jgi:hypothetical protein
MCIFLKSDQHFNEIDIAQHCKEHDFEISAIQLLIKTPNLIIVSLCTAPSGEVKEFLGRLDAILKHLYNPEPEFIICGDININYLNENNNKNK